MYLIFQSAKFKLYFSSLPCFFSYWTLCRPSCFYTPVLFIIFCYPHSYVQCQICSFSLCIFFLHSNPLFPDLNLPSLTKQAAMLCVSVCASWSTNCWAVWLRMPRLTMTSLIGFTKPCWSVLPTNSLMWGFRLRWPWHVCNSLRILTVQPSTVCFCLNLMKARNRNIC